MSRLNMARVRITKRILSKPDRFDLLGRDLYYSLLKWQENDYPASYFDMSRKELAKISYGLRYLPKSCSVWNRIERLSLGQKRPAKKQPKKSKANSVE